MDLRKNKPKHSRSLENIYNKFFDGLSSGKLFMVIKAERKCVRKNRTQVNSLSFTYKLFMQGAARQQTMLHL